MSRRHCLPLRCRGPNPPARLGGGRPDQVVLVVNQPLPPPEVQAAGFGVDGQVLPWRISTPSSTTATNAAVATPVAVPGGSQVPGSPPAPVFLRCYCWASNGSSAPSCPDCAVVAVHGRHRGCRNCRPSWCWWAAGCETVPAPAATNERMGRSVKLLPNLGICSVCQGAACQASGLGLIPSGCRPLRANTLSATTGLARPLRQRSPERSL